MLESVMSGPCFTYEMFGNVKPLNSSIHKPPQLCLVTGYLEKGVTLSWYR